MRRSPVNLLIGSLCSLAVVALGASIPAESAGAAAAAASGEAPPRALGSPPGDLDVVATAHLDTQWRWTVRKTIAEYLPATLHENFALFERYPDYVFSFEGAFRYQLIREYYPREWERLLQYVRQGRWRVCGSWLDAVDTNIPAPESLIRHALLGNGYFRRELGVTSRDVFLPDCFGFGWALPSVAAHCGLIAFSTQKLSWGSSVEVPFDLGLWEGVDGSTLVAALRPDDYVSRITADLSADSTWVARVSGEGQACGVYAGLKYFGTGDEGGGPDSNSVAWLERSLPGAGHGPLRVRSAAPDQLARDLTPAQRASLPRYRGELLMTSHGAGCYTSEAAMKRYNRRNEVLASAAEHAAVAADWLGAFTYPRQELREAWTRFLWHQFHDDLTGTSIPEAYTISWNDELMSIAQFADVTGAAVGGVARALDTRVRGVPLVVYNPLSCEREDLVEATVLFAGPAPLHVKVYGPDGQEVPSQVVTGPAADAAARTAIDDQVAGGAAAGGADEANDASALRVAFLARVPAVGFAVFDVRPSRQACSLPTDLVADAERLENDRYRLTARDGRIVSILDKALGRELLSAPPALQMLDDEPSRWSAWEIDHDDLMAPPRRQLQLRADRWEQGPARAAWSFAGLAADGSVIDGRVILGAGGAGDRIEIDLDIDWRTPATLLKAAFPLAARCDSATYDLGLGTIHRGTNTPRLYEVPAQRWADLTDVSGDYGVAVMDDSRYGWDRPDDHTLRLSLVHTPAIAEGWAWLDDQKSMDLGHHRVRLGLCSHAGDWRSGVGEIADRLNEPLLAFQVEPHGGPLGRQFGFVEIVGGPAGGSPATSPEERVVATTDAGGGPSPEPGQVTIEALKLAEESDEIVLRVLETYGRAASSVRLRLPAEVVSVREVNGAEEPLDGVSAGLPLTADGRDIELDLQPYRPRTLALHLAAPRRRFEPPGGVPMELPYDLDGISRDDARADGAIDDQGRVLAGELLPPLLVRLGLPFRTGPQETGSLNVLRCRGQELTLPEGDFDGVALLAATAGEARRAEFELRGPRLRQRRSLRVPGLARPLGQWDSRLVGGELRHDPQAMTPGYVETTPIGWVGTHHHTAAGLDEPYAPTCFYLLRLPLPAGARILRLPDEPAIRILAATAVHDPGAAARPTDAWRERPDRASVEIRAERRAFLDSVTVELVSADPDTRIEWSAGTTLPDLQRYARPVVLRRTTDLHVRAENPSLPRPYETTVRFERVEASPAAPEPPGGLGSGLDCDYYEGSWRSLPDFQALAPVRQAVVAEVGLPPFARDEEYGLVLRGYLHVPARGIWRLGLWSDDGGALALDGRTVAVNDGVHGRTEAAAELPLVAGLHRLEVRYFQRLGGKALELWWQGPGVEAQAVPAEALGR